MATSRVYAGILAALAATLVIDHCAIAQAPTPDIAAGLKGYQSFEGGQLDKVNLQNGNLNVHIPLITYPQRGRLKLSFSLVYNGKPYLWIANTETIPGKGQQTDYIWEPNWGMVGQYPEASGWQVVDDGDLRFVQSKYTAATGNCTSNCNVYEIGHIENPDGSIHTLAPIQAPRPGQAAIDGSGLFTGIPQAVAVNGNLPFSPSCTAQCYLMDGDGTIYHPTLQQESDYPGGTLTNYVMREDADGNSISLQNGYYIDSVGRSISAPQLAPTPSSPTNPLPPQCNNLSFGYAADSFYIWSTPGANGTTLSYIFCYAPVLINLPTLTTTDNGAIQGSVDQLVRLALPNGLSWDFQYSSQDALNSSCQSQGMACNFDDLTEIKFPQGATTTYAYTATMVTTDTSTGGSNGTRLVSRTTNANDGTGQHQWSYSWGGNMLQDPQWTVSVVDPANNTTVHTFTNVSKTPTGSVTVGAPYYETLTQKYNGSTSGTLVESIAQVYQIIPDNPIMFGSGAYNVLPSTVTTTLDNGKSAVHTFAYCCDLLSQTSTIGSGAGSGPQYDLVSDSKIYDYAASGTGTLLEDSQTTYLAQSNSSYASANMLNLVSQKTILNGSGAQVAQDTYAYDGGSPQASNISTQHTTPLQAVRGHITSATHWLKGGVSPVTYSSWYDTGEPYQAIDALGNKTTYQYSSTYVGALLTQETNARNQSVSYTYDPGLGLKTSMTDANGQPTIYGYDNYGRLQSAQYPAQLVNGSSAQGSTAYAYNDSAINPHFTVTTTSAINKTTPDVVQVDLDGYGRELETQSQSDPGGAVYVDTTYDALGRKYTVSNPYRTQSDSTYGLTTYGYDALSRPTTVTHPDGSILTSSYTGAAIQTTDEGNGTTAVKTVAQKDALGRVTSVCEVSSTTQQGGPSGDTTPAACGQDIAATGFLTSYTYDALGNLQTVTQGSLPARSFQYDSLSRLIGAYNPEYGTTALTGTGPCGAVPSGVNTVYCYDANGNLTYRMRWAPNQTGTPTATVTANYTYDTLNRLTLTTYTDAYNSYATPSQHFTYDLPDTGVHLPTQTNLVGRLSTSYTADSGGNYVGARAYSYDPLGRMDMLSECTVDDCPAMWYYELLYNYDTNGDLLTDQLLTASGDTYGFTLTYNHNAIGQLTSLTSNYVDGNHPATLFSANGNSAYSPLGGLLSGTLGNGATETFAYDVRDRLACATVMSGATTLYSVTLSNAGGQCSGMAGSGYSGNSNVLKANDSVNGNWSYSYDDLNRLNTATASSGPWSGKTVDWTYDRFGNRWSQSVTGQTAQSFSFTHGTNRPDQSAGNYDAAGNLLNDGVHTYVYDDENRIIEASLTGGGTEYYSYDAEGQRVRKSSVGFGTTGDGAGNTEEYVYDKDGQLIGGLTPNGSFNRVEIFAGARHLATYDGTTNMTYFIHDDWQATERVRSNVSGSSYEACTNLPYGDQQTCTGASDPSPLHYTGKMRDSETQLDYFGARYYSSANGHWMSPDWASKPTSVPYANFGDPQSLNLYGMVTGNPVSRQDADGHLISIWNQWGGWSSGGANPSVGFMGASGGPSGDGMAAPEGTQSPKTDPQKQEDAVNAVQPSPHTGIPPFAMSLKAQKKTASVVFGETSGLTAEVDKDGKPVTTPGADPNLDTARENVADVSKRNSGVYSHTPTAKELKNHHVKEAWEASQAAANNSKGSLPGKYFFIRQEGVGKQRPSQRAGFGQGTPIKSYGPFNNAGGGDVPIGTRTYIDIYDK